MDRADYEKLNLAEKRVAVAAIHDAVWAYQRWPEVLEALFLKARTSSTADNTTSPKGAGFGSIENNRKVEKAAIDFVTERLRQKGYDVESREKECIGYDLDATHQKQKTLHVEVKGVSGGQVHFPITANEVRSAKHDPDFWLYVVTQATSAAPKLHRFSGVEMASRFDLAPLSFMACLKKGR